LNDSDLKFHPVFYFSREERRLMDGRRKRTLRLRAIVGVAATALLLPALAFWSSTVAQGTVTVLSENWSSCTATTTNLWTPVGSAPYATGGSAQIPIKTWDANPSVTCPNWTVTPNTQTWLANVYSDLTSSATATGQQAIFLNEGAGAPWNIAPGQISRTLTGLRPGGFYEIVVEAWRDASPGNTFLDIQVVSGAYTRNLTLSFLGSTNGVQTIQGQFDVGATSATVRLTGGTGSDASPIVKSVTVNTLPTAVFNANDGTSTFTSQTSGSPVALTANAFTRTGYTFSGWNTQAGGGGTSYSDGQTYNFAGDLELYAQWTAVSPPTPPAPQPVPEDSPVAQDSPPAPVPTQPTPTRPPLDPIGNPENRSVPATGMSAGSSLLLVNGVPTGVVVAPNAATSPTGLVVTGDGFTMRLAGLNAQGQPLGLSYDGGALVLEQDRMARVEGTGFLSNSEVRLYVFSTPRYIGSVTTDASGSFSGEVPIPMDLAVGRHTLQANGYSKEIKVRSLSLGVVVKPDRAPRTRVAKATVTFLPLSAQLSPQTKDQLRALLKGRKGAAVRTLAVGYVQPTSVTANDEPLSTARAKAVKSYLRTLGLKGPVAARGDGIARETGAAGRKVVVSIRYTK
jgi:uncharacterized repeat protein (TIGR02543 family)